MCTYIMCIYIFQVIKSTELINGENGRMIRILSLKVTIALFVHSLSKEAKTYSGHEHGLPFDVKCGIRNNPYREG